jgi:hypothetical protein
MRPSSVTLKRRSLFAGHSALIGTGDRTIRRAGEEGAVTGGCAQRAQRPSGRTGGFSVAVILPSRVRCTCTRLEFCEEFTDDSDVRRDDHAGRQTHRRAPELRHTQVLSGGHADTRWLPEWGPEWGHAAGLVTSGNSSGGTGHVR